MKLNYKRTVLVGFAFFSICAFWQLYDGVIPLILRDTFHLGDGVAGFVMALDNILALFMLPLFGALSDRCHTRLGRRTPFLLTGTLAAAVLAALLPVCDRRASLPAFFVVLGLLLVAMGSYRSPAVALMPDVTPKPLRSKANAVINLMGALGGIYTLGMMRLLVPSGARPNYEPVFLAVALIMVLAAAVVLFTIRENKLRAEMEAIHIGESESEGQAEFPDAPLAPEVKKSLYFILASVALWFMGYNAVTTAFTKYATQVWSRDVGGAAMCLMIATGGAIVSYIPVGFLSSRFGRKRMILLGVAILALCFGAAGFFADFSPVMYVFFVLIGFGWASINVNSYPMVVEISRGGTIGKYTGYYYTFSMAAQIVTPIVSGALLEHVGYHTLFPYATAMVALSFITMLRSRHGDSRPEPPPSKLEAFDAMD